MDYFCAVKPQSRDLQTVQPRSGDTGKTSYVLFFLARKIKGKQKIFFTLKPKFSEANKTSAKLRTLSSLLLRQFLFLKAPAGHFSNIGSIARK